VNWGREFQDLGFKFQDGRLPGFKLEASNFQLIHSRVRARGLQIVAGWGHPAFRIGNS
jgi:hypothetical protein